MSLLVCLRYMTVGSRTDEIFQVLQWVSLSEKIIALKWFNQSQTIYLETYGIPHLFIAHLPHSPSVRFSQWASDSLLSASISDHGSRWNMCSAWGLQPTRRTRSIGCLKYNTWWTPPVRYRLNSSKFNFPIIYTIF